MSFQVFVLFDFMVQLNIDWMPGEVFMQATAGLLQVLAVAEGTSACSHICTLFIHGTIREIVDAYYHSTLWCKVCHLNVLLLQTYQCLTTDAGMKSW